MFERIVVGVSQVESATRAAEAALALAELSDATVHLVCALDLSERVAPLADMVPGAAKPPDHAAGQVKARTHAEHFLTRVARETKRPQHPQPPRRLLGAHRPDRLSGTARPAAGPQ